MRGSQKKKKCAWNSSYKRSKEGDNICNSYDNADKCGKLHIHNSHAYEAGSAYDEGIQKLAGKESGKCTVSLCTDTQYIFAEIPWKYGIDDLTCLSDKQLLAQKEIDGYDKADNEVLYCNNKINCPVLQLDGKVSQLGYDVIGEFDEPWLDSVKLGFYSFYNVRIISQKLHNEIFQLSYIFRYAIEDLQNTLTYLIDYDPHQSNEYGNKKKHTYSHADSAGKLLVGLFPVSDLSQHIFCDFHYGIAYIRNDNAPCDRSYNLEKLFYVHSNCGKVDADYYHKQAYSKGYYAVHGNGIIFFVEIYFQDFPTPHFDINHIIHLFHQ